MKNLTLLGKINMGLGVVFFILGIFLFVQRFNETIDFREQYHSLSFIFIGITIFLLSFLYKKNEK
ncbi:hypothetical protein QGM71_08320 [Virgibacillus sp. C22-A2]|uniref:Uncharacterized protein n=1 Tax=Virgibacillus tibetensis TaxID=3042313 RepID=A0ABU6KEA5_9BACI|nr:hypothetical protein [Virgibacillus sp. C22-A2]